MLVSADEPARRARVSRVAVRLAVRDRGGRSAAENHRGDAPLILLGLLRLSSARCSSSSSAAAGSDRRPWRCSACSARPWWRSDSPGSSRASARCSSWCWWRATRSDRRSGSCSGRSERSRAACSSAGSGRGCRSRWSRSAGSAWAPACCRRRHGGVRIGALAAYGFVTGYLFGMVMNLWDVAVPHERLGDRVGPRGRGGDEPPPLPRRSTRPRRSCGTRSARSATLVAGARPGPTAARRPRPRRPADATSELTPV